MKTQTLSCPVLSFMLYPGDRSRVGFWKIILSKGAPIIKMQHQSIGE